MKPGSVIVDMATEAGGNCPLSEKGKVVEKHGVTIIGYGNLPARIAVDASQLYARNVLNVVTLLLGKEKTAPVFNFEDEIIQGFTLIHNGKAVHKLLGGVSETKKAETPKSETPKAPTKAEQKADDKPAFKRKPESKEA